MALGMYMSWAEYSLVGSIRVADIESSILEENSIVPMGSSLVSLGSVIPSHDFSTLPLLKQRRATEDPFYRLCALYH